MIYTALYRYVFTNVIFQYYFQIENGNLEKALSARPEKITIGQSLMLSLKKVIEADHARGWEVKILWYVYSN